MTTTILFSYPLLALLTPVFRRIRRVDARYAYLVVQDGFVPLKRREGCLSAIWKYVKYQHRPIIITRYGDKEYVQWSVDTILPSYDEVSSFFQTQMLKEEYD